MRTAVALTLVLLSMGAGLAAAEDARSREDIEAEQKTIEKHLLRVQQERFEAQARGDAPARVNRLDKEFRRTGLRRGEVKRELEAAR